MPPPCVVVLLINPQFVESSSSVHCIVGTGQAYPLQVRSVPTKSLGTSNEVLDFSLTAGNRLMPFAGTMLSMTGASVVQERGPQQVYKIFHGR